MILKGNQRGGAKDLALHLMKEENEHVEIYQLRGFASENLLGSLNEAYAVSRGTRCKKFLFSLSLNPPHQENVKTKDFVSAIEGVEKSLGLTGQPRAIVFHEKEGRRHAHAVWSRIDTEEMKAVQLSFTHRKLQTISRELYLEHGWKMPRGLVNSEERDPKNFTLEEWQQAKRIGNDPRTTKTAIQDAWAISDSKAAFTHALEERSYRLARGDRRGFVAVDVHGEVYSIRKMVGVKTKVVRDRLGEEKSLPSVAEVKEQIANDMLPAMERMKDELETQSQARSNEFERRRKALVQRQRTERRNLIEKVENRRIEENMIRQSRFRKGFKGLWDRLRGEHKRVQEQNERESESAAQRDRGEIDQISFRQLDQRKQLNLFKLQVRQEHGRERRTLEHDGKAFVNMQSRSPRNEPEM